MDSPSAKKSKKKKSLDSNNQTPPKIFDDADWGELDNATINSTPNPDNLQAVFFKKKSTSASKKLAKNEEKKSKKQSETSILNSDKKRRISWALSQNEKTSFNEIDRSMQDSPDIPYEPDKIPKSKILKPNSANSTPEQFITQRSMVSYNTKMNGKSKAAKKLGLNSRQMLMAKFWK